MPIQLRILAILLSLAFFAFIIQLVRKDKAEVRHMRKWFVLAIVILIGAIFPNLGKSLASVLGVRTFTSLALFILTGLLLVIALLLQVSLIGAERHLKVLTQELSMLKKKIHDSENRP